MRRSYLALALLGLLLACPPAHAQSTMNSSGSAGPGATMGPPPGGGNDGPPNGGMQSPVGDQGRQNGHPHGPPPNITQAIQLLDEAKQKATSSDVLNLITQAETLLKQPPPHRQGGQDEGSGHGGPTGNMNGGFQQR